MGHNDSMFILLNAGLARHYGDWNWENVSSPFARLYMVKEGSAMIQLPDRTVDIRPGFIYLVPPFTLHRYVNDTYFSLYYFHIYENLSSGVRVLEEYNFPAAVPINSYQEWLIKRLLEINPDYELHRYDPSFYDNPPTLQGHLRRNREIRAEVSLETNGILCQLLSRFVALSSKRYDITDKRIGKVIGYIRQNIDKGFSLDELASFCYLSRDHFIRLFKKEIGITPLKFINLRKIEKAQLLLISTDLPIKNISQNLSFNNLSNFNRLFKQISGTTPEKYRYKME